MKIPRFSFLAVFVICVQCHGRSAVSSIGVNETSLNKLPKDTVITIGGYKVWIQKPMDTIISKGTLLLLPGWDYSFKKWCDSTSVCKDALQKGYTVVAPQMARSIYATQYFAETRADLRPFPTLQWLDSTLQILGKRYHLFSKSGTQRNFILGLSTGGRGVALVCAKNPGLFHAAAALSGDFNQANMPTDPLCSLVYGPYSKFEERWKTVDNPVFWTDSIFTPFYLGHGGMDKVVPVTQTIEFYDSLYNRRKIALMQQNSKFVVQKMRLAQSKSNNENGSQGANGGFTKLVTEDFLVLNISPRAGHNFAYWRSELPAIWEFFEKR